MRNTADVTSGKPIAVWSQSISAISAINLSRLLRHPWKKGRSAILLFCPGHHTRLILRNILYIWIITTNPHWARMVGYGSFSLCVIYKEGLCPSSGDINRLMMMISLLWYPRYIILDHRCDSMVVLPPHAVLLRQSYRCWIINIALISGVSIFLFYLVIDILLNFSNIFKDKRCKI
jgi:hypothetical protein